METVFGPSGFYSDTSDLFLILRNITRLVNQQQVYKDGKPLPFPREINRVVGKIMQTQEKLGPDQLDGCSCITKSNFVVRNYCDLLSLMVTNITFILPGTIPSKVLKVNDESQYWNGLFSETSYTSKRPVPTLTPNIHVLLFMAIKNQSQVILTYKGMKDTLACICHIRFKVDCHHNLEEIYSEIVINNCGGVFDFKSSKFNPTPRTIYARIKGIANQIIKLFIWGLKVSIPVEAFLLVRIGILCSKNMIRRFN